MQLLRWMLVLGTISCCAPVPSAADFWYGLDGPVPLDIDSSKLLIMEAEGVGPGPLSDIVGSVGRIVAILDEVAAPRGFVVCSLAAGNGYLSFMDSLQGMPDVALVEPYYLSARGAPMLAGQEICVAFDLPLAVQDVVAWAEARSLIVDRQIAGLPHVYVLHNTSASGTRCVELANSLHNEEATSYSHPDFLLSLELHNYQLHDYYHAYQHHVKRIIGDFNVATVWDFAGLDDTTVVAVVDNGVSSHEDLPLARLLDGYDFMGNTPAGPPDSCAYPGYYEAHGVACAGLIAADHTTDSLEGQLSESGVISMNPRVRILPIKIFPSDTNMVLFDSAYASMVAEAFGYAWTSGADVISNSWGSNDPWLCFPVLNEAIDSAFHSGRSGRGCPIVFSAGNMAGLVFYEEVRYPARLASCLAVGAVDEYDSLFWYSCYDSTDTIVDLVAPSGELFGYGDVWSIDRLGGPAGYNPRYYSDCPCSLDNNDLYICHFGGTSAACPLVAGAASLVLAKDPTLSADEVYEILKRSAVKDLDWGTLPDTPHVEYGYGRVDAFRAVLSISRGDIHNNGGDGPQIEDLVYLVSWMYQNGPEPFPSTLLADVDCTGTVDVADLVYLVDHMFDPFNPAPVNPCFEFGD